MCIGSSFGVVGNGGVVVVVVVVVVVWKEGRKCFI